MTARTIITAALAAVALLFAYLGYTFLTDASLGYELTHHTPEALPQVFGGRFLGLAIIIATLLVLSEWRAVVVVLGVTASMAFLDGLLEPSSEAWAHWGVAVGCAVLAFAVYRYLASRRA